MKSTRIEFTPSSNTEKTPTMPVASFGSALPVKVSEVSVASSIICWGASSRCGWNARVPVDIHVVLSSRLGSSSGVVLCGSRILDKFDDATSLHLGKEATLGKEVQIRAEQDIESSN